MTIGTGACECITALTCVSMGAVDEIGDGQSQRDKHQRSIVLMPWVLLAGDAHRVSGKKGPHHGGVHFDEHLLCFIHPDSHIPGNSSTFHSRCFI